MKHCKKKKYLDENTMFCWNIFIFLMICVKTSIDTPGTDILHHLDVNSIQPCTENIIIFCMFRQRQIAKRLVHVWLAQHFWWLVQGLCADWTTSLNTSESITAETTIKTRVRRCWNQLNLLGQDNNWDLKYSTKMKKYKIIIKILSYVIIVMMF